MFIRFVSHMNPIGLVVMILLMDEYFPAIKEPPGMILKYIYTYINDGFFQTIASPILDMSDNNQMIFQQIMGKSMEYPPVS